MVAQRAELLPGPGRPRDDRARVLRGPGSRAASRSSRRARRRVTRTRAPAGGRERERDGRRGSSRHRRRSRSSSSVPPFEVTANETCSPRAPTPFCVDVGDLQRRPRPASGRPRARARPSHPRGRRTNAPAGGFGKRRHGGRAVVAPSDELSSALVPEPPLVRITTAPAIDRHEDDRADGDEPHHRPAAHRGVRPVSKPGFSVSAA